MSYSIHYGPDKPDTGSKRKGYAGLIGAILIVLICAFAIGWAIPEQTKEFVQALFPWTRTEVSIALAQLRENIKTGQPLADAVSAFCQGILNEANQIQ